MKAISFAASSCDTVSDGEISVRPSKLGVLQKRQENPIRSTNATRRNSQRQQHRSDLGGTHCYGSNMAKPGLPQRTDPRDDPTLRSRNRTTRNAKRSPPLPNQFCPRASRSELRRRICSPTWKTLGSDYLTTSVWSCSPALQFSAGMT